MIRRFARTAASPFRAVGRSAFYQRMEAVPWGAVVAVLVFTIGLVGVLNLIPQTEPLSILLGRWQDVFDAVFLVAGLTKFLGVGLAVRWLHVFALGLLGTSVVIRFIVSLAVLGLSASTIVSLVFYTAIVWAVITQVRGLMRLDVTVQYRGGRSVPFRDDAK